MNRAILYSMLALLVLTMSAKPANPDERIRFTGSGDGSTGAFEVSGPWLLDWSTSSEQPLLAVFQMRLLEGPTDRYVGSLVEMDGVGNGLKLFEEGGSYRIGIVAEHVAWELEVVEISSERAEEIKRLDAGQPTLEDSTRQVMRRVREGSFESWRVRDSKTLLLFRDDGTGWRVHFEQPCPGLETATSLSFVTPVRGSLDEFDSVLLEDGTQCRFARVEPAYLAE